MHSTAYLDRLAGSLREGLVRLPASFRTRHLRYLVCARNADGGFGGRSGPSDLYYTGFALRAVDALDARRVSLWKQSADFLRSKAPPPLDVADVLSLLVSRSILERRRVTLWCEACSAERVREVRSVLERFRAVPAGFAKAPGGRMSLYHSFLAVLCFELLDEPAAAGGVLAEQVIARMMKSGGFGDLSASHAEGTNPSAAAVGLLSILGRLDDSVSARAVAFVLGMQRADGGFAAHADAPFADLMSTFTALVTLARTGAMRRARLADAARFAGKRSLPSGGFLASESDKAPDVEYTYYGLGALALLAHETSL
jgi:geranylgeranyl transferase type-2 subunit beta